MDNRRNYGSFALQSAIQRRKVASRLLTFLSILCIMALSFLGMKGKHYLLKMIIDADSHGGGTDPIFNIIEFESSIAEDWTAVTPDPELPQP